MSDYHKPNLRKPLLKCRGLTTKLHATTVQDYVNLLQNILFILTIYNFIHSSILMIRPPPPAEYAV